MAELEEGRVIGSYRVVRCIGQGGMGTVYEVEHVELGVHYALKTFTFDHEEDFGDKLLSELLTYGGLSSRNGNYCNEPVQPRFNRMISTENYIHMVFDKGKRREEYQGFETRKEDSPWIQLNLNKCSVVAGLQVDALSNESYNRSRHLRAWTSEDGKKWREVAAENQRKHRYRFDLQRKNVKAKYIRIGREPGFMKDYFALDKILVYGKEK